MPKIKLKIIDNYFKIFIDDLLHVSIKRTELIGLQSWLTDEENGCWYYIEYILKNREILTGYDKRDTWTKILTLLDKENIW